jgi:hypothetical protein
LESTKKEFESRLLKDYYLNVFNDDKIFIFIEPPVDWTAFSSEEMNKNLSDWDKVKKFDLRRSANWG